MIAAATGALLALVASPMRVVVTPGDTASIALRNVGAGAAIVGVAPAAYRLDLRGRPLVGRPRGRWLRPHVSRLLLRPGERAAVAVRVTAPRGARPGDHAQVLLLSAAARGSGGVRLAARIGVVLVVRCRGKLHHRLVALRVIRAARVLRLVVANRGNVDEWIGPRSLSVRLARPGRAPLVLRARSRRLLAGTTGIFEWRLPRRVHGRVYATATIAPHTVARFHLRL